MNSWKMIKHYKRNFLVGKFEKGKKFDCKLWIVEGKKLGLKEITLDLKMNRLIRENKIKLVDDGKMFLIV